MIYNNSPKNRRKDAPWIDPRVLPQWKLLHLEDPSNQGDYEHYFFREVISEFTDITGWDVEYWFAKHENIDHLYGEDPLKDYEGPYRTRLIYDPTNEESLIDLFGFSAADTVQYASMPKDIFERDVMEQVDLNSDIDHDREERKPRPGDVIKTLWDGNTYEIAYVNTSDKVFCGMKAIWSFVLKPFRINNTTEEETEMVFEELELEDFPEINVGKTPKSLKKHLKDNKVIQEESDKVDNYGDIDTSIYGYFQKIQKD